MAGLLFVTAPEADFKIINEALLSMRDWENSDGNSNVFGDLDVFRLITDKTPTTTEVSAATARQHDQPTSTPLKTLPENALAGASIEEVEAFCAEFKQSGGDDNQKAGQAAYLFVVIDSEGVETKTCVLASLPDDFHENPDTWHGKYDKVRVPWDDAYMIWCNLDIANMNFDEFVQEEEGDEQGWFTYQSIYEDDDEHQKELDRRDRKLEEWRRLGHI